jgi:hypothetical protein
MTPKMELVPEFDRETHMEMVDRKELSALAVFLIGVSSPQSPGAFHAIDWITTSAPHRPE